MSRDDLRALREACEEIREAQRLVGHVDMILSVKFSPDGRMRTSPFQWMLWYRGLGYT